MHKLHVMSAIITIRIVKAWTAIICSRWFSDACIIENGERLEYT